MDELNEDVSDEALSTSEEEWLQELELLDEAELAASS